jgi:hypothetical protein
MKKIIIFFIGSVIGTQSMAGMKTFNGTANTKSPCTNENLTVHGITTLAINETVKGVFVNVSFTGVENGYTVTYSGNAKFQELKKIYPVYVTGEWKSSKENFSFKTLDLIFTKNNIDPTGDNFKSANNECKN